MKKLNKLNKLILTDTGKAPISLRGYKPEDLYGAMPHISLLRHQRCMAVRMTLELLTPARSRYLLKTCYPNRSVWPAWARVLEESIEDRTYTPSLPAVTMAENDRMFGGGHHCQMVINTGLSIPVLVIRNVCHDEIAHAEGNVYKQNFTQRIYRKAKLKATNSGAASVGETISGLVRAGMRSQGTSAQIRVHDAATFLTRYQNELETVGQTFKSSVQWVNRAPVRGRIHMRVLPHVNPADWIGAMQVTAGHVKVPAAQFAPFQALQNTIVVMQGNTGADAEPMYFFSTLLAWSIYLGKVSNRQYRAWSNPAYQQHVVSQAAHAAAVAQANKQQQQTGVRVPVMLSPLQLVGPGNAPINWRDPALQQTLLRNFPWTRAQSCGLSL